MLTHRVGVRNAERRNAESMWCESLYDEKFRLHVQARMVLALIPAEDVLQCEQSLHTSYDDNATSVGFH